MRFLKQAVTNPRETGAAFPSSRALAELMVAEADLKQARLIVELGPGTGAFTEEILAQKESETGFMAIELNPDFVRRLKEDFPKRDIYQGSAADIATFLGYHDEASCDRVISGIPWTLIPAAEREEVIAAVASAIEPGGLFLTFAYVPLNRLKAGRQLKSTLERHFSDVRRTPTVVGNVPPAFVYICEK